MSDQNTSTPAPQAVTDEGILAHFENGTSERVVVPRMKLGKYQACYAAHASGDEFRLLELACDRPGGWAIMLTPDSYDALVLALYQRNASFFGFAGRREMMKGVREVAANAASRGLTSSRG